MKHFAKAACLLLVFGILAIPQIACGGPIDAGVTATLTYIDGPPGNATYRFDYTVDNFSLEPYIWGFVVFFNEDFQDFSDFVSYAWPTGWEDVFVLPEPPEGGPWSVEWDGGYEHPNPIYPGESLEGFSVTFIWTDFETVPGPQSFEVWNGHAFDGTTVVVPSGPTGVQEVSWGRIKNLFR